MFETHADSNNTNRSLPKIPEDWKWVKLKFLCTISADYGLNISSSAYKQDGVRFLRTTDIDEQGGLNLDNPVYINPKEAENAILKHNDLLISRSGTVGRSFRYSKDEHGPCAFASYLVRFRPKPSVDSRFLEQYFQSKLFEYFVSFASSQSTISNVSGNKFAQFPVPVPPEQKMSVISRSLQPRVNKINKAIEEANKISSLSKHRLNILISNTVQNGIDGKKGTQESSLSWLGKIPENWEIRRLKYCCEQITDAINNTAPTTKNGYGYMIRTTQISDGDLDLSDADMVEKDVFEEWNRRETPHGGDVVFTREAPVGEACILPANENITLGQRMMLIRTDDDVLNNYYLLFWFYSEMAKHQYNLKSHGSTVDHLRVPSIPNLNITLPPRSEQDKIVEYLIGEKEKTNQINQIIESTILKLEEKRQSLITNSVTGTKQY